MGTRWKLDPVGRFVQRRESQVVGGSEGDVGRNTGLVAVPARAGRDAVGPRPDERQKSWVSIDLSASSEDLHHGRRASAGYDGPRSPRRAFATSTASAIAHDTPKRISFGMPCADSFWARAWICRTTRGNGFRLK